MKATQTAAIALVGLVFLGGCDSTASEVHASARIEAPIDTRYQLDLVRDRIWGLTGSGVSVQEGRHGRKSELSLPGWFVAGALHSCPPALALGPDGEAVITSNVISTLWKVDPVSRAVSAHPLVLDADNDKDVGFSGLVYAPEHAAYFAVSGGQGTLWKIDASLTRAEKVSFAVLPEAVRADRTASGRLHCLRAQRLLYRFAQSS